MGAELEMRFSLYIFSIFLFEFHECINGASLVAQQ